MLRERVAAAEGSYYDRTRRKILKVAHKLYTVAGYASVSMREVAKKMGFSAQAIYYYFPSKEAMFAALADEYAPGHHDPHHHHKRAQLIYACAGVTVVITDQASFVVPPQRAVWVPAGMEHEAHMRGHVSLRTLYIDPAAYPDLPTTCRVIEVSSLLRELIEDTKDAVGGACAVAVRFAVDEFQGAGGVTGEEARDVVAMLAQLPDLWDVNAGPWHSDSAPSRFAGEGAQEPFIGWVKQVTNKPVVGVGRFTSPDAMASQLRRGVLDMIGAARPSIADPFLPKKIEEGRIDDIRECIGCNICASGDSTMTPIRCTQNPSMGEEWRKGWHPERIAPKHGQARVLIVGAGPAGLEAARALGQRGYEVHLAEASRELGGRVSREARLPGLAAWARVRDWRVGQLAQMSNVTLYRESHMQAEDVLAFGADHVVLATGATWRRDGFGRSNVTIAGFDRHRVFTPDEVMAGVELQGPVLLFDDDGFYMGSVLAEALCAAGQEVIFVTPAASPAPWTVHTLESPHIQKRLRELDVKIIAEHNLVGFEGASATLADVWTSKPLEIACANVLAITSRLPNDALWMELAKRESLWGKTASIRCIGDAAAPGAIVHAVYDGHRCARELGGPDADAPAFRRWLFES